MIGSPSKQRWGITVPLVGLICFLVIGVIAAGLTADDARPAPPTNQPAGNQPAPSDTPTPDFSDAPTPDFSDLQSPNFGDLDTPNFGEVDLPNFGDLDGPDFSDLNNPDFSDLDSPDFSDLDNPDFSDLDLPQIDTPDSEANTNDVDSNVGDATNPADLLFRSPAEASGLLGESIPLRLDMESTVLVGSASDVGLRFDTTRNRLVIAEIDAGSLVAHSGLQVGDQVLAVERTWIRTYEQLIAELTEAVAGDGRAWLLVSRDGQRIWVSVDLAVGLRPRFGVNTILADGTVILSNVGSGSAADIAGLRVGDVILSVNGGEITSHGQLLDAIMLSALNDGRMELVVSRDGAEQHVVAEVDRLIVETASGVGNDFTADSAAGRASEELSDEGLTFAAETIDSVFASANALLTATESMAARTEGKVHDDAQTAAVLARELKDVVQELDGDSAAEMQGRLGQLIATADELDRRLTSLAIEDLGDGEESLAAARDSITELREDLDAISSSIVEGDDSLPR